jgi:hypothetical protein
MPGSSKWSASLRSPHQNPVCTSPLTHTCYMPRPPHSFDHSNNIWWWVQIIKFLVMQSSPLPCYLVRLVPNSKESIQVRGFVMCFVTWQFFTVRSC